MSTGNHRVAALDIAESARLAAPAWRDFQDLCDSHGVKITSVPMNADDAILRAAAAELADASQIAILACPDPFTATARDLVAQVLGPESVTGMDLLLDKGRTRQLCGQVGVPTPAGLSGPGRQISDQAMELLERTGRVVVKDPLGYAGMGVRAIDDRTELRRTLDIRDTVVVETYINGEEFSVEAVCGPEGIDFVGWAAKGGTDALLHPLERVRYVPAEPVPALLATPCRRLLKRSGYHGIVEIELVVQNGEAFVLEANPRTSGLTAAFYFTGRTSSLRRHLAALLGVAVHHGAPTAGAEYGMPDSPVEPEPTGPQSYCYHPPPGTEFDSRAYLWGDVDDLHRRLTTLEPARGAQFADRVEAASEVLSAKDGTP